MLLSFATERATRKDGGATLEQVLSKVTLIEDGSASLGAYARTMILKAAERGVFGPRAAAAGKI